MYSKEQLNTCSKEFLIDLVLNLASQNDELLMQTRELNHKMDALLEQVAMGRQLRFGKSSETGLVDGEQMNLFFNEAEALLRAGLDEPDIDIVVPSHTRKKHKGKRNEDLSKFPVRIEEHTLPDEELTRTFKSGYKRLPDEIYKKLDFHPASFEVIEHHIAVYADKSSDLIVKAEHPKEMLDKSIVTPSLAAAIINAKYVNALPLYRQEQEFERNDVHISRQLMAGWIVKLSERHFSLIYDALKSWLLESHVIHADETPVKVTKDGRESMHKSYMWVYRTGTMCGANPIILYEYQKTRKADFPREFLQGFQGSLVCDGYQVYHTLADERPDEMKIAGCWIHARRRFANVVKTLGKDAVKGTLANDALLQITQIQHLDNKLDELSAEDRLAKRNILVRPCVQSFFAWVKQHQNDVPSNSETGKGFTYCLNQEKYLMEFLSDGMLPMDNNVAEQAIRPFCIGKNNWKLIDTINGAKASAILYSLAETAKSNNLKPYEYFKYLLTEIPKHLDDYNMDFIESLLPWSNELPEECRKKTK